jgi:hypothetical protein
VNGREFDSFSDDDWRLIASVRVSKPSHILLTDDLVDAPDWCFNYHETCAQLRNPVLPPAIQLSLTTSLIIIGLSSTRSTPEAQRGEPEYLGAIDDILDRIVLVTG